MRLGPEQQRTFVLVLRFYLMLGLAATVSGVVMLIAPYLPIPQASAVRPLELMLGGFLTLFGVARVAISVYHLRRLRDFQRNLRR